MADDLETPSDHVEGTDTLSPMRSERTPKLSDYLRVFTYATKWDYCTYAAASLASIGAGVTMPLSFIVFGQLTSQITEYFKHPSNTTPEELEGLLAKQALFIMGLFLARWGLNSINKFCFRMIGIRLSSAVRLHYLQSLLSQSIHVIDTMPPGAPATAITTTTNTLQMGISERLGTFLTFTSTIVAAFAVSFTWSWNITLVTSSLILYTMAELAIALPFILKRQTATAQADLQATAIASEALESIRLVHACGAQDRIISRYGEWVNKAMKLAQGMGPATGGHFGLISFGMYGAFGLAFWYGIQRYMAGAIDNPGVVIIVIMSVMLVLTSVERISTPLIAVNQAIVAACELFTVIDMPPPASGTLRPDLAFKDLVFEGVTFEYPSRPGVRVLDDLSFRIRSGQNTALVGPSGSGKSTIVGLLERWYSLTPPPELPRIVKTKKATEMTDEKESEPDSEIERSAKPQLSGSVRVGEDNLEDLDSRWWRANVGLVQQEPFLFNDTIFHNLANGLVGTEWQDAPEDRKRDMVEEACREAHAHDFIRRLPDGYDTRVGDGGAKLSGGQKQRVAIARSIIKKPQILILDEATSAIDVKSERIVQAALDRVSRNRTTITIAHRLSTISKADHIVVLQGGRAVEQGTHQSLLMNEAGVYSGLVRAQLLHLTSPEAEAAEDEEELAPSGGAHMEKMASGRKVVARLAETDERQEISSKTRPLLYSFGSLLYEQRAKWLFFLGIVVSAMGVGAATPIQAWLIAKTINVFLLGGGDLKREGDFWGLMWLALAAGIGFSYVLEGALGLHIQYFVSAVLKMQYFAGMLHQRLSFFDQDNNAAGSLSSRISGDAKRVEELLGMNLAAALSACFALVGCVVIALVFSWKLGIVGLFVTMPIMIFSGFWKLRHELQFDQMNTAVFMESSQFATEAIGAIRTVSALTMEDSITARYQKLLDGHVQAARRKAQWTAALFGFADSSSLGCQALIFWYGSKLLTSGELGLVAFFVCYTAIIQGVEAGSQVLGVAPNAAQAAAAANRILDIHESETTRLKTKNSKDFPEIGGGVNIELRNVHFKYPARDVVVFDNLSLSIERGQYVALVGPSGCGKTTIISLLERFYDLEPDCGEITCNGLNIKDFGIDEYRQNLSLVAQEPTLFRGTIRDSILFGVANPASISEERIHEVCRDAFIHDFIISLPEGYDTEVGQKGVSMSGGQKQRIAIARALIRNPKILLLDEATSALDSESEKIVQEAFEKARRGRTMIAVAHRLSTIQNADVIFVFDDGRVVERGSHDDLIRKKGVYWEMVCYLFHQRFKAAFN
ncbi:P-loop containing nucleoside triphosphate hydrolase protein [Thozetella sp. PMI_491]|nr:P-loop containing nucleoside triphosphate hydrolase protein [Thozetella sp. PMI_491]